jgi:hypothetical protein
MIRWPREILISFRVGFIFTDFALEIMREFKRSDNFNHAYHILCYNYNYNARIYIRAKMLCESVILSISAKFHAFEIK